MNRLNLHIIDYVLIAIYFVVTLLLGFHYSRKKIKTDVDNYLLAGRKISLPAFTATLVSTWYGGILGIGEFTWLYGILNWVTQALPYYLFAVVFALYFAPRIQRSKQYTIPDLLYRNFGTKTGLMGSLLIFVLVTPAPYLLMMMFFLSNVMGIPLIYGYVIAIIFSVLYVYFGGFQSVVKTDILQFVLMFVGFFILIIMLISNYGGFELLRHKLPTNHLTFTGGMGFQYVLVWFFIALWTFVDPGFYQRCYAAESPQVAKNGILVAVGFWILFDLMTTTSGLYARVLLSDVNPVMVFPKLGEMVLPPFYLGLFVIALLATVMSTLDSTAFLSAVTFGRDFLWRIRRKSNLTKYTKIGLILSILIATLLIIVLPSVVKIWYTLGSVIIPALIFPVIITFFRSRKYLNDNIVFSAIFFTFLATITWFIIGVSKGSISTPVYLYNLQPFYVGLGVNGIIMLGGLFVNR
ncbi:MAG: sodium:solute symporter family protein [Candidatus Marinimicrobia bacterium]|nr:sodium:solute symporter family protein [Candidatus Neomarinimicrobiota bacterium]